MISWLYCRKSLLVPDTYSVVLSLSLNLGVFDPNGAQNDINIDLSPPTRDYTLFITLETQCYGVIPGARRLTE